ESAMREAGDILIPMREGAITAAHIIGEIGEAAAGAKPGRGSETEITLYKSLGVAAQDLFAAHAAYLSAREAGAGQRLD
ncbi:MAG: ornithine cyclodeaminase, partial [Oricola sp.]|nr:ornithine cyclodeaminase [Oricola sp.]